MKWTVPHGQTEGTVRVIENNTVDVTQIYGNLDENVDQRKISVKS